MQICPYAVALIAALFVVPCLAQTPATAPGHPPVEAFGSLPSMSNPSLSPDGKHLALIQARNGRPVATVWTLDPAGTQPAIIPYEDGFIVHVQWVNNTRLFITINLNGSLWGSGPNAWYRGVIVDADGQHPTVMFNNITDEYLANQSTATLVDLAPNDPDNIYMPLWSDYGMVLTSTDVRNRLYRVNVNNGRAQMVVPGTIHTETFYMDGGGNVLARKDMTKDPLTEHLFAYNDSNWREIATADATGGKRLSVLGPSLDAKSLVLSVRDDATNTGGLVNMSLADGKMSSFYYDPLYDVQSTLDDPWTGRVIGATIVRHLASDVYFDPKYQALQAKLEASFPGQSVSMVSWDLAADKVVICVNGLKTPPTYYLFQVQTNALMKLGRAYAGLQQTDLGDVRVYDYKARDGLEIPAYLTLPPDKEAKNLPVVILPHGGPSARDTMNFDWESQFFANRGYAVLQPNFRGSWGYGRKFEAAGYGQWGLKMQDDVTDGVKKLIADGIADPKRICIVGGSYGGYAALAGAAFTPDLYACAAAWAPVTDLRQMLLTDQHESGGEDSWLISAEKLYVGDRSRDAAKLDAVSPALNAAKFRVPVLLMHGEADATVRINQSEIMERALRQAGKPVTFIRIPKETHHMQTADTRIRWLTEVEKFLRANIGN